MEASDSIKKYFESLTSEVKKAYEIAQKARAQGYDPEPYVDIPLANDIAERVEGLIGAVAPQIIKSGVAQKIRELENKYSPGDWRVALEVSENVAKEKFCKFSDLREALEVGVRVGLAYITLGIVSAPLEGFVELRIKKRRDGKEYVACYYAGPIRAAGGTAASVSLLIADYLRKKFDIGTYDPTDNEVERYNVELDGYHNLVSRLQYYPVNEEVNFLIKNLPVEITGDPTSKREVLIHKDLKRVGTPRIRGGMCLVLAEGIAQKAGKVLPKIMEWGKDFGLQDWVWIKDFLKIQKSSHTKESEVKDDIVPNYRYMEEAVAGRPVFSHPMRKGGFRIRYGRTRLSGLAATAVNPLTMTVCGDFIATGTQLKVERPGKATSVTPCDYIEGPVVKLRDGSVHIIRTHEQLMKIKHLISEILFLGDLLVCYGDFFEQKHNLIPSPYVEEWWIQDVQDAMQKKSVNKEFLQNKLSVNLNNILKDPIMTDISFEDALKISDVLDVPIHPRYLLFFSDISTSDILNLSSSLEQAKLGNEITIQSDEKIRKILQDICIPHSISEEGILLKEPYSKVLLYSLGYLPDKLWKKADIEKYDDPIEAINKISHFKIMNKSGIYLGARMGRPEKAKIRKMKGSPHCLFPVGQQGGRMRNLITALDIGFVEGDFPIYECVSCNHTTITSACEKCGQKTTPKNKCPKCEKYTSKEKHCGVSTVSYENRRIDIKKHLNFSLKRTGAHLPEMVKGVRGTTNKRRVPEALEKGILRAIHDVYVNKDGTTRFDAIEVPITHFMPKEIDTTVNKLLELGYSHDINGEFLERDDQILELKPQDIIMPNCEEWEESKSAGELIKITKFVDHLLTSFYRAQSYYNVKNKNDLLGHLVVGLAPHTSAGILGRIIGFSKTQGYYAHPYFHAAMRRNCDGDESSITMLMDALLNFSRHYLPDARGSRTMDAPLVLTTILDPNEIDNEVHNMDVVDRYSLEFYESTKDFRYPWDVDIEKVFNRLNKKSQYEGIMYTHPVTDMNIGNHISSYKTLVAMTDKVQKQMELAEKIKAVDKKDVASLVIEKHFIRDIKGNLRRYSGQEFRCINCNFKYRRIPLSGKCSRCSGKLVLTVAEGTVSKYLEPSLFLARKYEVSPYIGQILSILKRRIESIFGREKEKQIGLTEFT